MVCIKTGTCWKGRGYCSESSRKEFFESWNQFLVGPQASPGNIYQVPPYDSALCLDLRLLLLHKIQRLLEVKRKYKEDLSDPH